MTSFVVWPLAFIIGLALGMVYFRFLWLTVRHLSVSAHPFRLLLMSFAARAGVVLGVFYLALADGHWERLLLVLAGFISAREICKRLWGKQNMMPMKITS